MAELADRLVAQCSRLGAPAMTAATVDADGRLIADAVGHVASGADEHVVVDDLWHIGSCTKTMTAVAWARLVEAGVARWEMPVADAFADLEIDRGWADVTIDQVLLGRAGLPANPPRSEMRSLHSSSASMAEQREAWARRLFAQPPRRPGRFRYSNLGYVLIGAAIDRFGPATFEESLDRLVFDPLAMSSPGFGAPPRVSGHGARRRGALSVGRPRAVSPGAMADNPPLFNPAGRVHLTMADWARFQRVFIGGAPEFLTPSTVEHLTTAPSGRPTMAMGWVPARADAVSLGMQGSNTMWSAAVVLNTDRDRAAMVIINEGRRAALRGAALFAVSLLGDPPTGPSALLS